MAATDSAWSPPTSTTMAGPISTWPAIRRPACYITTATMAPSRRRAVPSGVAYNFDGQLQSGMGVAVADYNGDGLLDIAKTNFSGDIPSLFKNEDGKFFRGRRAARRPRRQPSPRLGNRLCRSRRRWLERPRHRQRPRLSGGRPLSRRRSLFAEDSRVPEPRQRQVRRHHKNRRPRARNAPPGARSRRRRRGWRRPPRDRHRQHELHPESPEKPRSSPEFPLRSA